MENINLEFDEQSTDEMFFINIPENLQKDEEQEDEEQEDEEQDVSIPKIIFIVPYRDREQQLIFF